MTRDPDPSDDLSRQRMLVGRLDAATFPHDVDRISVIETHISFVILTGGFAYKIKKAVDLGFVDYRGLDRRLFYCREELRLNRRLAESIYLDVVGIGGSFESPRIGAASPPLEYAVKMIEFDQEDLLDRILARGELKPAELDALAAVIADFQRRTPVAAAESAYGTPAVIAAPMLGNFADLRRLPASAADHSRLDALEAWSRAQCGALQHAFTARRQTGCIREGHGDLHLGNMVRFADGLHVFDCIEFNADFRWIDVISEIAFLVMDLSERGRPDYAYRFLSAYLENTGDYPGLGVLRFYLVYRALVRAKVARIRAMQPAAPAAEREAALHASRAYVEYAYGVIATHSPTLVLTHGFSGSGKSVVAGQLVEALASVRLRSDVERKRLHGLPALTTTASTVGAGIYDEATTTATYRRLRDLARVVLDAGFTAIVDATFLRRWQRDQFRAIASELRLPFLIVDCDAPADVLAERIVTRRRTAADASEATLAALASQQAGAEPLGDDELAVTLRVETTGDGIGELVDRVRRFIEAPKRRSAALPPLQGEGWGGDGVRSGEYPPSPPDLPLEGGGTV